MLEIKRFSAEPTKGLSTSSENTRGDNRRSIRCVCIQRGTRRIRQPVFIRATGGNEQVVYVRPVGVKRTIKLLVDSGAEVSIIKHNVLGFINCEPRKVYTKNIIMENGKISTIDH